MQYLVIIASIYLTLLVLQSLYNISLSIRIHINNYIERQRIKSKLHPEVSIEDIENEDGLMTLAFSEQLVDRVMNNDDEADNRSIVAIIDDLEWDDDDDD